MQRIPVHILCSRDTRSSEELENDRYLESLNIRPSETKEVMESSWQPGYIFAHQIEGYYPAVDSSSAKVMMASGNTLTLRESMEELTALLDNAKAVSPDDFVVLRIQNYFHRPVLSPK